jgi:hypothetical protein
MCLVQRAYMDSALGLIRSDSSARDNRDCMTLETGVLDHILNASNRKSTLMQVAQTLILWHLALSAEYLQSVEAWRYLIPSRKHPVWRGSASGTIHKATRCLYVTINQMNVTTLRLTEFFELKGSMRRHEAPHATAATSLAAHA